MQLLAFTRDSAGDGGTHLGVRTDRGIQGIGAIENPVVDEEPRVDDHARAAGIAELLAETR